MANWQVVESRRFGRGRTPESEAKVTLTSSGIANGNTAARNLLQGYHGRYVKLYRDDESGAIFAAFADEGIKVYADSKIARINLSQVKDRKKRYEVRLSKDKEIGEGILLTPIIPEKK